jgi:hypothetical protein
MNQAATISRRAFAGAILFAGVPAQGRAATGEQFNALRLSDMSEAIKPNTDITAVLDRALQLAAQRNVGQVLLPGGEYLVETIKMRSRVKLKGLGRGATRLKTIAGATANALVTLSEGPVINAGLEGMTLVGGTPDRAINPSQWAIDLDAKPVAGSKPPNGGLWWSSIQDVGIVGFSKGVRLQGGAIPGNYQLPHQFVSVRDFVVYLSKDASGPALKLAGQVAQISFDQCQFDHFGGIGDLTLLELGRVNSTAGGPEPSLLRFEMCTFQSARQAVAMAEVQNVSFNSCWFEQLQGGIEVGKNSSGVIVNGSRFANAASLKPAIEFLEGSHGTVSSNIFAGSATRSSVRSAAKSRVVLSNNVQTLGAAE